MLYLPHVISLVRLRFPPTKMPSASPSFIVMYLKEAGVNIVTSVFSTQILFDLIDKGITVLLVLTILKALPANIKVTSGV